MAEINFDMASMEYFCIGNDMLLVLKFLARIIDFLQPS